MAVESTQPLSEVSTRNIPGCKERPSVRRLSRKCESLDVLQPYESRRPYRDNFTLFFYQINGNSKWTQ
jgi:hypothetical protein